MTLLLLRADTDDLKVATDFKLDPEHHVQEIRGRILAYDEEGPVEYEDVGRFLCYRVDIGRAMDNDIPFFEVFDAHSDYLVEFFKAIYKNGWCFRRFIEEEFEGETGMSPSLFIIAQIGITAKWRGKFVGLQAMTSLMHWYAGNAAIAAMKVVPLQFGHSEIEGLSGEHLNLDLGRFTKDQKTATRKLFDHFANIGFVRLPNTPFALASTLCLRNKLDVE
jgi:hypothetical protein